MKLIKYKQKLLLCFSAKEITTLLLSTNISSIVDTALQNTKEPLENKVTKLSSKNANDRDQHELWVAVFSLYYEFKKSCEFCFYLKDTYNRENVIKNFQDLVHAKTDPPDIIICYENGFYEFELKRYRERIDEDTLLQFIKKKILRYSEQYNFYIILQLRAGTEISFDVFRRLNLKLITELTQKEIGRICFVCNSNNIESLSIHVYPSFGVFRYPFATGSEQFREIMNNTD